MQTFGLLTQPRSPTTTGKVERFHRTMRQEFDTTRIFASLKAAQQALDEWVAEYNHDRPHQSVDDQTPAQRFGVPAQREPQGGALLPPSRRNEQPGQQWVSRKVASNGIVCVDWQQVSVGKHRRGEACDVLVTEQLLQFWIGNELLKTVARTGSGQVRKKNAQGNGPRS